MMGVGPDDRGLQRTSSDILCWPNLPNGSFTRSRNIRCHGCFWEFFGNISLREKSHVTGVGSDDGGCQRASFGIL